MPRGNGGVPRKAASGQSQPDWFEVPAGGSENRGRDVGGLCPREGLAPKVFYRWSKEFLEEGQEADLLITNPRRRMSEMPALCGLFLSDQQRTRISLSAVSDELRRFSIAN